MNKVPDHYAMVPPEKIKRVVASLAERAGMPEEKSRFLADLLVRNDSRGVFSHGSRQIAAYARIMRDGLINPNPEVKVISETPATLLVDGDGAWAISPLTGQPSCWSRSAGLAESPPRLPGITDISERRASIPACSPSMI